MIVERGFSDKIGDGVDVLVTALAEVAE
jgi:hypothetical protein